MRTGCVLRSGLANWESRRNRRKLERSKYPRHLDVADQKLKDLKIDHGFVNHP